MPNKDGTGPAGAGAGTGRGQGRGQAGAGRGRNRGPLAAGPGGFCVCPGCGTKTPHIQGQPCSQAKCPQCGSMMTRE